MRQGVIGIVLLLAVTRTASACTHPDPTAADPLVPLTEVASSPAPRFFYAERTLQQPVLVLLELRGNGGLMLSYVGAQHNASF